VLNNNLGLFTINSKLHIPCLQSINRLNNTVVYIILNKKKSSFTVGVTKEWGSRPWVQRHKTAIAQNDMAYKIVHKQDVQGSRSTYCRLNNKQTNTN